MLYLNNWKKKIKSELVFAGWNLALMQPCVVGAGLHFCHFPSVSLIWACLIIGWNKREELIEEEEKKWAFKCGCWSPVTAPLGHMVLPEVVLVRSRHAIHRGVWETRRLRRHTHLPSTKPLLYGGRPVLNFAQQPSSVVGDVVLWRSATVWHTSWLFQSEITLFSDYFKVQRRLCMSIKFVLRWLKRF